MFSLNYPLNIQVETVEDCNHHCFYCYNYWRTEKSSNYMNVQNAKRLVNIIEEEIHPFHITITGGEPLLNINVTLELTKGLKKRGFFYNLNTNLILLNKRNLERLQEASTNSKFGILTSLPHFELETYNQITGNDDLEEFYINLKNITKNEKLPITVNMVVHQMNKESVYEEGKFLFEKFGVKNFAATPMIEPAYRNCENKSLKSEEIAKVLEDLVRLHDDFGINVDSLETIPRCLMPEKIRNNDLRIFNRACSAGRSTLSIGYDGSVRACSHTPFISGNIFKDGFRKIWDTFSQFRENKFVPKECDGCLEFYGCYGGCRVYGYQERNPLNKKDPRMTEKILETKKIERSLPKINFDREYKLNKNIIYRRERKDLFTFFNGNFTNVLFVNEGFKNFILGLREIGKFKVSNLDIDSEYKEKAEQIIKILIDRKYIE